MSPDRRCALALLTLSTEFLAIQNLDVLQAVNVALDEARENPDKPQGLELAVSGSAAIGGDFLTAAKESIDHTELMTVLLVLVILALVYRAEPFDLYGSVGADRGWQLDGDTVDDPRHGALFAVEVQRAVLEVLHDPLRLLDLAAGRQPQSAAFVAECRPCAVDGTGDRFGAALRRPVHR